MNGGVRARSCAAQLHRIERPHALKIPARRADSTLTENVASPFQAEPRQGQVTPAMHPMLVLNRQRGPDRERNISGVCSTCGDILLERLDAGDEKPNPEFLRAKLDRVFEQHVAENHSQAAATAVH